VDDPELAAAVASVVRDAVRDIPLGRERFAPARL